MSSGSTALEPPTRHTPHLSHSRINRYLHCPEQYRLYYVEGLRPRIPSANLVFGKILHQALAELFSENADPVAHFLDQWKAVANTELDYSRRDTWETLRDTGERLLGKFVEEAVGRLANIRFVERKFSLNVTSLELEFVGVIDLVADLDGQQTVVDFKTAASAYGSHEAKLNDQLTAYQLVVPDADQAALCVLLKTKEPRIAWHVARRKPAQVTEYLDKVRHVGREIRAERFFKRPGMWCAWCDYLPVCARDERKVEERLIQIGSTP